MKSRYSHSLWLAMAMLALGLVGVSCTKSTSQTHISFSAQMRGTPTRTSYSGEGTVTGGKLVEERIDWTDGDLITIYSPQAAMLDGTTHLCDYRIVTHSTLADNLTSRATIEPIERNGLQWGTGTHAFYARYPSGSLTETQMTGTIPSAQNPAWSGLTGRPQMQYAYMFARTTGVSAGAEEVNLKFEPAFTAFEFTVGRGKNASVALTSFTLATEDASGYLAGGFTLNNATFTVTTASDAVTVTPDGASKSITVSLEGKTVSEGNDLTFTVLALPKDLTKLKMTFEGPVIGIRTLRLNDASGSPLSFAACKKYRIQGISFPSVLTAEGEEIEWDLEGFEEDLIWDNTWN